MRELLTRIDSRELSEWAAYEQVAGPIGPARGDLHAAIVASTVANVFSKRRYKPSHFLPKWDRRPQSWQEQLAVVKGMNAALGGTVNTGKGDDPDSDSD